MQHARRRSAQHRGRSGSSRPGSNGRLLAWTSRCTVCRSPLASASSPPVPAASSAGQPGHGAVDERRVRRPLSPRASEAVRIRRADADGSLRAVRRLVFRDQLRGAAPWRGPNLRRRPPRTGSSRSSPNSAGGSVLRVAQIFGCALRTRSSASENTFSDELLAGPQPGVPDLDRPAASAARRSCGPGSTIRTGSPMSRTNVSAYSAIAAVSSTSPTASSTVMKNRVTSGWVTVTGWSRAIWSASTDRNEPRLPSTLPKRTEASVTGPPACALHDQLGQPLGRAEHRGRVGRLVGRDQHEPAAAVLDGRLDHVLRAAHVRLDGLARRAAPAAAGACGPRHGRPARAGSPRRPDRSAAGRGCPR